MALIVIGVVVAGFVLLGIIGNAMGGGTPTANTTTSPTAKVAAATPAPTPKPTPKPAPPAHAPACTQPCAVNDGVTVTVSNVQYGWTDPNGFNNPTSGNVFVSMTVTVANHGSGSYNFNESTFTLQDGAGIRHTPTITSNDSMWSAVDITPGATQSETMGFEARANMPNGLVLRWQPNLFGGSVYTIKLS